MWRYRVALEQQFSDEHPLSVWHCRVALEEQVKSLKRLVKDQSKTIQDLARRLNARNTHERRKHEREPVAPLDPVAEDHGVRSAPHHQLSCDGPCKRAHMLGSNQWN